MLGSVSEAVPRPQTVAMSVSRGKRVTGSRGGGVVRAVSVSQNGRKSQRKNSHPVFCWYGGISEDQYVPTRRHSGCR